MKFRGITKRWIFSVASLVLIMIVVACLLVYSLFKDYYYGAAKMKVEGLTSTQLSQTFTLYGADVTGFEGAAREYVENYANKDQIAIWVLDSEGRVVSTSSGFSIREKVDMPDFEAAIKNGRGTADWTGKLPSGEKIMASTTAYYYSNGNLGGGIRFMVSMDEIDRQLQIISVLIIFVALFMYAVFMISGMLFIRSIVNPVKEIGKTAKRIAGGDLNANIDYYPYNDEIGNLCDTINDMADKLSETDRLKNDFISTISHELRTPLTAIKGWGETLIQLEDDPDMTKRGMGIIISEAGRLNDMVEELLDFSRMSSGRMKYKSEKMDYLAELDDAVYSFRERVLKEGIELNYNFPDAPAPGTGDPQRIRQVFINLLDNAIKYNQQGGSVEINAEIIDKTILKIQIADTGVGIKEEDLPHIKEKFYKANNTVRGSGIGLAVCDEIIKHHDGNLEVDSVFGEGTTVTVFLPLDKPKVKEESEVKEENSDEQEN
ncbi:MAG: HAMP domain-containing histidine kinase [Clostridia bacterium]|nr:HAMP domain-containing histidine kinase [Clostridia bacterium]